MGNRYGADDCPEITVALAGQNGDEPYVYMRDRVLHLSPLGATRLIRALREALDHIGDPTDEREFASKKGPRGCCMGSPVGEPGEPQPGDFPEPTFNLIGRN